MSATSKNNANHENELQRKLFRKDGYNFIVNAFRTVNFTPINARFKYSQSALALRLLC